MKGYSLTHENRVVTVFSAANYCYFCGNEGAIIEVDEHMNMNFLQFEKAPQ